MSAENKEHNPFDPILVLRTENDIFSLDIITLEVKSAVNPKLNQPLTSTEWTLFTTLVSHKNERISFNDLNKAIGHSDILDSYDIAKLRVNISRLREKLKLVNPVLSKTLTTALGNGGYVWNENGEFKNL